jgi:hypothetical protein
MEPTDQAAVIEALTAAVDQLGGQVAALTAYIIAATGPLLADEIMSTRELAQKLAPAKIGPINAPAPGLHASEGVVKLQTIAASLATARSAGTGT